MQKEHKFLATYVSPAKGLNKLLSNGLQKFYLNKIKTNLNIVNETEEYE